MPHNLPRTMLSARGQRLAGVRHRHRRTDGVDRRAGSRVEAPRAIAAEPKPAPRVIARPAAASPTCAMAVPVRCTLPR